MNQITKVWAKGAKAMIEDPLFPEYTTSKPTNACYVAFGEDMNEVGNDPYFTEWITQGLTGSACRMWYRVWFALNGHKDFIKYLKLKDERIDAMVEAFATVWSQKAKMVRINLNAKEFNSHVEGIRQINKALKGEKL